MENKGGMMSGLPASKISPEVEGNTEWLVRRLRELKQKGKRAGIEENVIKSIIMYELQTVCADGESAPVNNRTKIFKRCCFVLMCLLVLAVAVHLNKKDFRRNKCAIGNNYLVMEITRPITDCSICEGVHGFRIFENVTKEEFAKYAYLGQPMLVKGGCLHWPAVEVFSFDFFKKIYEEVEGAYESVEEECQFFPFKTEFLSLKEVFHMPESRAKMSNPDEKNWYIGWSNCNPDISSILRKHYSRPDFLPDDSELSVIDWIFMGYAGQGASMHLDYVQRPSWQAQIAGTKSWYLLPPPECEIVCHAMNITVHRGDIILIDTNQWYHTTHIEGKEMSITLGSEYD